MVRHGAWGIIPCILTEKAEWASYIRAHGWAIMKQGNKCLSILDMMANDRYVYISSILPPPPPPPPPLSLLGACASLAYVNMHYFFLLFLCRIRQRMFGLGNYTASATLRIASMVWIFMSRKELDITCEADKALDGNVEFFVVFGGAISILHSLTKECITRFYDGNVDNHNASLYDPEVCSLPSFFYDSLSPLSPV